MAYFVYILKSLKEDHYYTGSSANPQLRLEFHNTIEKGYTSRYRPWELVLVKEYSEKAEAQRIEQMIKKWKSKKMIERLIKGEIQI